MGRYNPNSPPVTGAVVRLTAETVTDGQRCQNTFDFMLALPGAPSAADLDNLIAAWGTVNETNFVAVLSPKTTYFSLTAQELHYGTTPSRVSLITAATVGTAGATSLPIEMGATLARYGDLKGQHGRGRITMPAVPNTFVTPGTDSNKINGAGTTAYTTFMSALIGTLVIGPKTWTHVISARPIPPDTLVQFALPVTTYLLRDVLGTQRRRKEGRGI